MPDGRVYLVPTAGTTARIFDPSNNSVVSAATASNQGGSSGVLLPNGKIFLGTATGNKGQIYDPSIDTITLTSSSFSITLGNCIIMRNGKMFCTPYGGTSALIFGGGGGFNLNVAQSTYFNKF